MHELALKNLDRMTAREKYRTLGVYYLGTVRDYQQAIDNFELLVKDYPADNMGHANLALSYVCARNLPRAMEEGKKATADLPQKPSSEDQLRHLRDVPATSRPRGPKRRPCSRKTRVRNTPG